MRSWVVASGLLEGPEGLLLVQNRRRGGSLDWTPPGGVVEVDDGESVRDGLTREVEEETGLRVTAWEGPVWSVEAEAASLGWRVRVEVHRALGFEGDLRVGDDPDGIVVDARFVAVDACHSHLVDGWPSISEPIAHWLAERWTETREYRYRVDGEPGAAPTFTRL